jgi:multidrug efflux pump subunit AcrA (membrane-fusion protein)
MDMTAPKDLAAWLRSPQCGLQGDERVQEAAALLERIAVSETGPRLKALTEAAIRFGAAHAHSDALDAAEESEQEVDAAEYDAADSEYNASKAALVKAYKAYLFEGDKDCTMSNGESRTDDKQERAWDTRRKILEETVILASLDLFGHTGSHAFRLPIPNTTPQLFVTAGELLEVKERTAQIAAHRACCGTEHDPANGKLHGCCVVCGVPWPCEYAGKSPVSAERESIAVPRELFDRAVLWFETLGECGMIAHDEFANQTENSKAMWKMAADFKALRPATSSASTPKLRRWTMWLSGEGINPTEDENGAYVLYSDLKGDTAAAVASVSSELNTAAPQVSPLATQGRESRSEPADAAVSSIQPLADTDLLVEVIGLLRDIEGNAAVGEPDWSDIERRIKATLAVLLRIRNSGVSHERSSDEPPIIGFPAGNAPRTPIHFPLDEKAVRLLRDWTAMDGDEKEIIPVTLHFDGDQLCISQSEYPEEGAATLWSASATRRSEP